MICTVGKFNKVTYTLVQYVNGNVYLVLILLFHIAAWLITEIRLTIQCCWKVTLFREGSRRAESREDCFQIILCYVMCMPLTVECSGKKHFMLLTWSWHVCSLFIFCIFGRSSVCAILCAMWLFSGVAVFFFFVGKLPDDHQRSDIANSGQTGVSVPARCAYGTRRGTSFILSPALGQNLSLGYIASTTWL